MNPYPAFGLLGYLVVPLVALLDLLDSPGCMFGGLALVALLVVVVVTLAGS